MSYLFIFISIYLGVLCHAKPITSEKEKTNCAIVRDLNFNMAEMDNLKIAMYDWKRILPTILETDGVDKQQEKKFENGVRHDDFELMGPIGY